MTVHPDSQSINPDVFWAEIAPSEHLVQIYQDDGEVLASLGGFVGAGLVAGDAVIVLATPAHLAALDHQLSTHGFELDALRAQDLYIPVDAENVLAQFIVNGWPEQALFEQSVSNLLSRARKNGRRVRAFGEMVAILWGRGQSGATVRLEHLWHTLCQRETFSLFCAYPRNGFTQDAAASIQDICATHSRVIASRSAA